jgi:uncharacterized protein YgiM (DUF1202 family)
VKLRFAISILSLATMLLLAACSSIEYNSTNSPKMVVSVDYTPFYRNGPLQGNGPDLSLAKGDEVEVLRKEIGYSFVRIYDGQNGYVANDDLKPVESSQPSQPANLPQATLSLAPKPVASPTKASAAQATTNTPATPGFRY